MAAIRRTVLVDDDPVPLEVHSSGHRDPFVVSEEEKPELGLDDVTPERVEEPAWLWRHAESAPGIGMQIEVGSSEILASIADAHCDTGGLALANVPAHLRLESGEEPLGIRQRQGVPYSTGRPESFEADERCAHLEPRDVVFTTQLVDRHANLALGDAVTGEG